MRRSILFLSLILAMIAGPFARADSQTLSDQQISAIRANCVSAQSTLQQLQRNEAVTRINRGYEYENLLKLLAAFNSRVALNKLDAPNLLSDTSNVQTTFSKFQKDYLAYDNDLTNVIRIPCAQQPVTFYNTLNTARAGRVTLASDVEAIDSLIEQYQGNLTTFAGSLASSKGQQ